MNIREFFWPPKREPLPPLPLVPSSVQVRVPEEGDWAWYRGFLMKVVKVNHARRRVVLDGTRYEVTTSLDTPKYAEKIGLWYIPGMEGQFPRAIHGTIMAPTPPESRYKHHQNQQRLLVPLADLIRDFQILTRKEWKQKNG